MHFMKNKFLLVVIGLFIIFAGIYLTKVDTRNSKIMLQESEKLQIVASFYPLYFFASQIGKDKAQVINITPSSAEPHDYEPTTQDIAHMEKSNMLIVNGGKLEAWADKLKDQLQGTTVEIVVAGDNLANKTIEEEGKTIQDPHVWQDPILAKQEVANIEKGFEKIDPKDASYFQKNAQQLQDRLDQLDNEFTKGLLNCQKKDFVTSHAAFGYLAARYGITQIAISGVSPDEEPSTQKLVEIANLVKKQKIDIIFFESLVSPKLSQTIAQETGAQTMVLDPIEGISDDDMKAGHTYFTIMKDNLANLKAALQCSK
jgi:zinc transport system substrate-binding protein